MQTFVVSPNLAVNAQFIDNARLHKQHLEAWQIYTIITGRDKSSRWANHPVCKQWMGYDAWLILYGQAIEDELDARRISFKPKFRDLIVSEHVSEPPWWHDQRLHASHRSRLLFKGRHDALCASIRKFLKLKSIKPWLAQNGYPPKARLKHADVQRLEEFAAKHNISVRPNWYAKFNWPEPDNLPYFWPSKQKEYQNAGTTN